MVLLGTGSAVQTISSYLRQSDFASSDDYASYVRDHIGISFNKMFYFKILLQFSLFLAIGMHVRCCRSYDDLGEGDVGHVVQLDRDGLHDLNLQVLWLLKERLNEINTILPLRSNGNRKEALTGSVTCTLRLWDLSTQMQLKIRNRHWSVFVSVIEFVSNRQSLPQNTNGDP